MKLTLPQSFINHATKKWFSKTPFSKISFSQKGLRIDYPKKKFQFLPWDEILGLQMNKVITTKGFDDLDIEKLEYRELFLSQLRRRYYNDPYLPDLGEDFIDIQSMRMTDAQLAKLITHLIEKGWSTPYEYIDLYENTLFWDSGHKAKCLQSAALLHFIQKSKEVPDYIDPEGILNTYEDVIQQLKIHLPPSIQQALQKYLKV